MLIVHGVSAGVVPYFADGRHPGRWSPGAGRLLGRSGAVDPAELRLVLEGRDPSTGDRLEAGSGRRHRRAGWDLVFGAPKSLSLLAASGPADTASIRAAHVAAVDDVVAHLEARLVMGRGGPGGRPLVAEGLVAAAFDHDTNAASEPHLHTHVVVANLSRSARTWGPVSGSDWFIDRRALGGLYHLSLRHQLAARDVHLDWRLRPDGLADLAVVPRTAVREASTQTRAVAQVGRYEARRLAEAGRTEGRPGRAAWANEPVRSGRAAPTPGLGDPAVAAVVSTRLTARRSDFRRGDVVVALAASYPGGAPAAEAVRWADRFCAEAVSVPSPTRGPRWATAAGRHLDQDVADALEARRPTGTSPALEALAAGRPGAYFLGAAAGRSELLAQAEFLAERAQEWSREGRKVAVTSMGPDPEVRWAVLAGLGPYRPGDRPDILVVDRADRRCSGELLRLLRSSPALVVFVEGGTLPRLTNPASHGLVAAADRSGRAVAGPHQPWRAGTDPPGPDGPRYGRAAAAQLLSKWREDPEAVLVGLGLEEVGALNAAVVGARPARGPDRFRAGDRVVVVRSAPGLPRVGTLGRVEEVSRASGRAGSTAISWPDGTAARVEEGRAMSALGFGYALSPRLAAATSRPLLVLGPAAAVGRSRARVVSAIELEAGPPARRLGRA